MGVRERLEAATEFKILLRLVPEGEFLERPRDDEEDVATLDEGDLFVFKGGTLDDDGNDIDDADRKAVDKESTKNAEEEEEEDASGD